MASETDDRRPRPSGKGELAARERVLQLLRYSPDIALTFTEFAAALRHLVPADRVWIALLEEGGRYRVILADGESPPGYQQGSYRVLAGSAVARVVREQVPYLCADAATEAASYPDLAALAAQEYRSVLLVPLLMQGTATGVLGMCRREAAAYDQPDLARLVPVTQHLSLGVAHYRLAADLHARNHYMENLHAVAKAMNECVDLETVCDTAAAKLVEAMQVPLAIVYLLDERRQELELYRQRGLDEALAAAVARRPLGRGISGIVAQTGQPVVIEDVNADPQGSRVLPQMLAAGVRCLASLPLRAQQHLVGVMTIGGYRPRYFSPGEIAHLEDIGAHVGTAIQRASLYQETVRSRRRQEDVVAFLAHELRSPLQSVLGFCQLLLHGDLDGPPLSQEQRDCIEVIEQRGRHQMHIIESLLAMASSAAGHLQLAEEAVPVAALLDETLESYRPQLGARGLALRLDLALDLPPVRADAVQLARVLDNLIGNAVKYAPAGSEIAVAAALDGADLVRLSVHDTGPPIPAAEHENIFLPFHRLRPSGDVPGAGLGLAIARALVEQMGGRIGIETTETGGNTFYFTVPVFSET